MKDHGFYLCTGSMSRTTGYTSNNWTDELAMFCHIPPIHFLQRCGIAGFMKPQHTLSFLWLRRHFHTDAIRALLVVAKLSSKFVVLFYPRNDVLSVANLI
jgi:hypothetical protein